MTVNSRISGFYKLGVEERRNEVRKQVGLTDEEDAALKDGGINLDQANRMVENVIGKISLPLGVATNFMINGKDYLIPMATEEPSVVAAASNAAKMAREGGGFTTESTQPLMIGQIQLVRVKEKDAEKKILEMKKRLIELANSRDATLVKFGGGARDLEVRKIKSSRGDMIVAHLIVNVADAMGANTVNTMCETIAPELEKATGGKTVLRIISNYAVNRLARAKAVFTKEALGGEEVVDAILDAYALADADVYRAVTHNKGIMNGITSVVMATGNDTRAVEAGCHAYASRTGRYRTLTEWSKNGKGDLEGSIEVPMAVGLVGGATKTHPTAKAVVRILGVKTAKELSEIIASVGLSQNLGALRALATEGIQRGHMSLHARNMAVMAGAKDSEVDKVAELMVKEGRINVEKAKEIIKGLGGATG
ncbi:MAG: hydroxymethylglutaryl-CoA reductase, degradative [Candidatus Altiarchaeota archaeon]|nr:hydroxymethylglutaryl-CoA reductase, degradative [Candidatus Altiarchaeota archaeon]